MYMKEYFIVLSASLLVNGFFAILSTYLTSNGHTRFVNKVIFFSILINVSLNYIFIPQYGGKSAAITTLISTCFLSSCYLWYLKQRTNITFPLKTWGILLMIGSAGFVCYIIGNQINLNWLITTTVSSVVIGALSLLTKVVRINNIFKERFN